MPESRITFTDIVDVNLGSLGTAVGDWKSAQSALLDLSNEADRGMRAKADAARWEGINAGLGKRFVRKIANEVGDLHSEAQTIWNLLDGAHSDLVSIQTKLKAQQERAGNNGIRIQDNGDGTVTCEFQDSTAASGPISQASVTKGEHKAAEFETKNDIQGRINTLVAEARMVDQSVRGALLRAHGNDPHNAGHATYTSLDDAQAEQATAYARKQLKLYEQGKELSTKDLESFAALTKHNARDPEFATSFYRDLGPKNALLLHAQLGIDASSDGSKERLELARVVQNSMGTGLATATDPPAFAKVPPNGDATHLGSTWVNALKAAGRSELPLGRMGGTQKTIGYQVLGNILRHGTYDTKFLNNVGNDIVAYEREHGGSSAWPSPGETTLNDAVLNLDRKGGAGYDPMEGLMRGLNHSPEAATDFFDGSTGGAGTSLKETSNFDYFLGDGNGDNVRTWPGDGSPSNSPGRDALGDALQSATTGRPAGDEGPRLEHTRAQADLFEKVVSRLGTQEGFALVEHGGKLSPIADNMGAMAGDYMPDIQKAIAMGDESGLIQIRGETAELQEQEGSSHVRRFINAGSQDPDGYASIIHAQHETSSGAIARGLADPPDRTSLAEVSSQAAYPGAEVAAFAAQGRADGIDNAADRVGAAEKYNEALDQKKEWVGTIASAGLERAPGPVGDAVGMVNEAVFDSFKKDPEEAAEKVADNREEFLSGERSDHAKSMKLVTEEAARKAGVDPNSPEGKAAADYVAQNVRNGYKGIR
ncbi:DUF6571 family protein [Streptomyces iconiensis]|uniref:AG2 protein n=1 Tax=Streptomyces iconiensis TaxID=1384038 RepID=A0ABT6ZZU5_9ACTN|nr:DUF6571 family protein [Streptomyces iconiensis]MDJ1134601.1 hypothetical protein [Streptomyces iconiensis]